MHRDIVVHEPSSMRVLSVAPVVRLAPVETNEDEGESSVGYQNNDEGGYRLGLVVLYMKNSDHVKRHDFNVLFILHLI